MKGTVKFFDEMKGYGFIETDGDEEDHFVHRTELQEGVSLEEGDRVDEVIFRGHKRELTFKDT